MPGRAHSFTNRGLRALQAPPRGSKDYHDTKVRGLVLQVTSRGAKTFQLVRKVKGRTERTPVGSFPETSVEQARQAAMRLLVELAFTKANLAAIPPPAKGRKDYHDRKTRGLVLHVTAHGSKVFYLVRKVKGRTERIKIGPFADLSIEEARGKAAGFNSRIAKGDNPAQDRRAIRSEDTLQKLFDTYLVRHAKPYNKTKTTTTNEWLFEHYLACWAARKLSTVRLSDVQTLHSRIGEEHGHYAANAAMRLLRTLFSKATKWGWVGANPVKGIEWFHERSRERFLGADELPRFFTALAAEPNTTFRDFVLVSLLTGARRANVQQAQWSQVNLEAATWTLAETKGGKPQTVILPPAAVTILKERRAAANQLKERVAGYAKPEKVSSQRERRRRELDRIRSARSEVWVFPGLGKTGHLVEPKTAWKNLLVRAELSNLRLHDLRRTLGSWQASLGTNLAVIQKTLGHADVSTTMIYARLNLDPVRQAVDAAAAAMLTAGGVTPAAEVVPLKKGTGA